MAESSATASSDQNLESPKEYSGPDKCAEQIATAEDEVITVGSEEGDVPDVVPVDFLKACARCGKNFTDKSQHPKLLPCLHSMCEECVVANSNSEAGPSGDEAGPTRCTYCGLGYSVHNIMDNFFIKEQLSKDAKSEDAMDGEPTVHECTGCEEKELGTSFCLDCTEWLCDVCVSAHKRVKVTKDHKIVPKEEAPTTDTSKPVECALYCTQHKQEKLNFFCETCDILTCRDCQLVGHKDHKYQFLDVAATNFKSLIGEHVLHMGDRSKKLKQVRSVIDSKLDQVKQQHSHIVKQVQDQADGLIKQIIQNARQLLQNVKVACETMARRLAKESSDIVKIMGKYDYCIQFVDDVMKDGSNMSLLLSKASVLKECARIYSIPIEAQTVKSQFSVQYRHDNQFIVSNLNRFGAIFVNGQRYHPQDKNMNSSPTQQPPQQQVYANTTSNMPNHSIASHITHAEKQLMMALKQVAAPAGQQHMQSLLSQKIQQQHQRPQPQASAIPNSVSKLVSQMRMTMPQSNTWQTQQHMQRPEVQQVPMQRPAYSHNQQQQQQPFQPMRLQHRPATVQNVYSNQPQMQMSTGMPKMNVQQQHTVRGPPPLIRSPSQSSTPPNTNHHSSTGSVPTATSASSSGLIPGVRVKQERRSSYDNDCVITGAKIKGEKTAPQSCSGPSPKSTSEAGPVIGGTWMPSSSSAPPTASQPVETEKSLEKVIEDLPMEDLPSLEDIDATILSADHLDKQLQPPPVQHPVIPSSGKNGAMASMYRHMSFADPNEDYCACCHNGGEVLCCDSCPKVFHLQCHIPPLNAVPSGKFICTMCATGDNIRVNSPVPEDPTGNGNKRKAPTGLTDQEIKVSERLMLELFCHDKSVAFHEPVSKQVPNYYKIIQNPIDFTTIKCKLSRQHFNHYNSVDGFISDVKLVFQNCATYNQESSEVGTAGKTLRVFFEELVAKHLPHYLTFASTYPPRPGPQTFVESDGSSEPKRQKTDDPVLHIA